MAIRKERFSAVDISSKRRQGYLCYLKKLQSYHLFLRQDSQDKITIMAKTPKYTIDIGSVPDNIIALIRPVMNRHENHFVFINDSHISGSKGLNYSLSLDIGWYA